MSRFVVLAAGMTAAGVLWCFPAAAEGPSHVVTGRVSAGVVDAGDSVRFGGSGFAPHATIALTSEGTSIGTTQADGSGAFLATVSLSGAAGFRAVAGTGLDSRGATRVATVTVRVLDAGVGRLPRRSSEPTGLALLAGFGVVVLAAGGRLLRQRQRAVGAPAWP